MGLEGLTLLLVFQGFGEALSLLLVRGTGLVIPGPVIGMVLLAALLVRMPALLQRLEPTSQLFSRHLGLLFIPAAVGIAMFVQDLAAHGLGLLLVLLVSVVISMATTGVLLSKLWRRT